METVKNIFWAVAEVFGWARQRDAEKNSADQQANAEAKLIQADGDKTAADQAKHDTAALGKDIST